MAGLQVSHETSPVLDVKKTYFEVYIQTLLCQSSRISPFRVWTTTYAFMSSWGVTNSAGFSCSLIGLQYFYRPSTFAQ
jgi:hypothetical protein